MPGIFQSGSEKKLATRKADYGPMTHNFFLILHVEIYYISCCFSLGVILLSSPLSHIWRRRKKQQSFSLYMCLPDTFQFSWWHENKERACVFKNDSPAIKKIMEKSKVADYDFVENILREFAYTSINKHRIRVW